MTAVDRSDAGAERDESDCAVQIERIGPVVVATFTDSRILDHNCVQRVSRALENLLAAPVKAVLLDFVHVEFMSAAILGKLIFARKRCLDAEVELRLCSLAPDVFEVFKVTRLTEIFALDPDRRASLSQLLAPQGFPFPSSDADWLVCADWWEEQGDESIARACRNEAAGCRASNKSNVSS